MAVLRRNVPKTDEKEDLKSHRFFSVQALCYNQIQNWSSNQLTTGVCVFYFVSFAFCYFFFFLVDLNTSFITPDFKNFLKKKILSCIILPFSLAILVIAKENERDTNEKKTG